jgi:hypothetical protein
MRVRITHLPPVDHRHGVVRNRVYDVLARKPKTKTPAGYWIMGDAGKPVLVLEWEAVEVPEKLS